MRRFGLALLLAAGFGGSAFAQDPYQQQPYVGRSSFGGQETLFRYDDQEPWKHGWKKQMPYHEGFHSFRPYNYHHVFGRRGVRAVNALLAAVVASLLQRLGAVQPSAGTAPDGRSAVQRPAGYRARSRRNGPWRLWPASGHLRRAPHADEHRPGLHPARRPDGVDHDPVDASASDASPVIRENKNKAPRLHWSSRGAFFVDRLSRLACEPAACSTTQYRNPALMMNPGSTLKSSPSRRNLTSRPNTPPASMNVVSQPDSNRNPPSSRQSLNCT